MNSFRRRGFKNKMGDLPAALTQKGPSAKSVDTPQGTASVRTGVAGDYTNAVSYPTEVMCFDYTAGYPDVLVPASGTGSSNTPTAMLLNGINTGGSISQRLGRVIKIKSCLIKGSFQPSRVINAFGTDGQSGRCRVALVYDRQANGSIPNWSDVFAYVDTVLGSQSSGTVGILTGYKTDAWAPPNPNNAYRFLVIRDCRYDFQPNYFSTTGVSGLTNFQQFVLNQAFVEGNACGFWKNVAGLETRYLLDSSNDKSSIATGSLWLVTQGDTPHVNSCVVYRVACRLRFYDAI